MGVFQTFLYFLALINVDILLLLQSSPLCGSDLKNTWQSSTEPYSSKFYYLLRTLQLFCFSCPLFFPASNTSLCYAQSSVFMFYYFICLFLSLARVELCLELIQKVELWLELGLWVPNIEIPLLWPCAQCWKMQIGRHSPLC